MILNYKKLGDSGSTIIILHGLLGSLDNWQTIAKQLVKDDAFNASQQTSRDTLNVSNNKDACNASQQSSDTLHVSNNNNAFNASQQTRRDTLNVSNINDAFNASQHQVYIIDQRNHGRSPHADEMNYEILAKDIQEFCQQYQINKTTIIGHSMGGKVAMLLALQHPELIDKLIVVDIAPTYYDGGHESILFAMAEAPLRSTDKRQDIDKFLEPRIHDFGVRQFIMKNLSRNANGQFEWKCNFEALILNYRKLMDFPKIEKQFLGNTYFIKGEHSNYINQDNFEACDLYFPNNKIIEIKHAGHWIHADNPTGFVEAVTNIL
jgi:pimeloyl-ACP methyl ester carboxylesterase